MRSLQRAFILLLALAVVGVAVAQQAPSAQKPGETKPAEQREPGLYMTFETEKGNITCKLFEKEAPLTVHKIIGLAVGKISYIDPNALSKSDLDYIMRGARLNLSKYKPVRKRLYDGLVFHRVIPGFMIQGGDPLGSGMGSPLGPGFPFKDEFVAALKFDVPGRLAMANSGPNTNGSQFFITEVPTPRLNGHHTIFGQCGNVDVVRAIARAPRGQDDRPNPPVHMKRVIIERVGLAPPDAPEGPERKAPGTAPAKSPGKNS
jgi:peptidyl-prolyl cis-trans isomerase A (cyclophilin A)